MKTIEVKEKRYICENCGRKHSSKANFYKDEITNKEICTKCTKKLLFHRLVEGFYYEDELLTSLEIDKDAITFFNLIQNILCEQLEIEIEELKKLLPKGFEALRRYCETKGIDYHKDFHNWF